MPPLFDFYCNNCHKTFEKLVKNDVTVMPCPNCKGESKKKLSAPAGIMSTGEGFYKRPASKPPED